MKTTILICLMAFSTQLFAQNIWRCNNDPNVPISATLFRTLQEAHDAASNGDIIYVEPSNYAGATISKTLRIIGNGYEHATNPSASQNWDKRASSVGTLNFVNGSSGSIIEGISNNLAGLNLGATNITVTRCSGLTILLQKNSNTQQNADGAIITDNYGCGTLINFPLSAVNNITIKNNIGYSHIGGNVYNSSQISANNFLITNNVFGINQVLSNCSNCIVHSNIFSNQINPYPVISNSPGTVASYNVCGTNPCGYGTNNVDSANPSTIFSIASPYADKDYQLPNSSPAKAAGLGGIDAGAFGGATPYVLSGLPAIPQITSYSKNASSGIYTSSTPMSITISVKGNN